VPALSAHAAPTATDLYPGDDGSVSPASGRTASDAAAAASSSSSASQSAQNGHSSPTDLNPIDDAAGAGSQAGAASNPTTAIGGLTTGGVTTAGEGAIGPVAAQNGPSAPMSASAAGAMITGSTATGSAVNSIVVMPDQGLRVTEPAEISQAVNPRDMVTADGGQVSDSSVDAAAAGSQASSSLDGSAPLVGLAGPLNAEGSLTRSADLVTEFLPFDRASVENAIDQFLEGFEGLSASLPTDLEMAMIMSAGSTLMAIAAVSTAMIVRRRSGAAERTATEEVLEKSLGRIFNLTHL
jgi:hypothetical protein